MFEAIFGNKTAAQVLLYLNTYQRAYATQISHNLNIPLNMVQKQLDKFAKGQILSAYFDAKKKYFSWNDQYPFLCALREFLNSLQRIQQKKINWASDNPADGSNLSLRNRLLFTEDLYQQAVQLNPYQRPKPFVKSFENTQAYENWRKRQKNPWLI